MEPLHSAVVSVNSDTTPDTASDTTSSATPVATPDTTSSATPVAYLGEVKTPVLNRLKISATVSVFELDLEALLQAQPDAKATSVKLSKFPSVERDITLKVSAKTPFTDVSLAIQKVFNNQDKANPLSKLDLNYTLTPISVYQSAPAFPTKNLSFHLRFASNKKTLDNAEISVIMETVEKSVKQAVGAEII